MSKGTRCCRDRSGQPGQTLVSILASSSIPLQCNFHGGLMAALPRRTSVPVKIGDVWVGGDHPNTVLSMTKTEIADTAATVHQDIPLAQAGSELVRVTVNTEAAAQAVPKIVDTLDKFGV